MDRSKDGQGRWVVHGERTLYDNRWVRLGKAVIITPSGDRFEHHTVTLPSAALIAVLMGTARWSPGPLGDTGADSRE
ncbi:hypothetical protein GCM10009602_34000 [Nocardiopsis tropica]